MGDLNVMKVAYEKELRNLQNWINNANNNLKSTGAVTTDSVSVQNICYQINRISDEVLNEYPFYATELKNIASTLFMDFGYGTAALNNAAFGELYIIISHIIQEPVDTAVWREIHPRIVAISKELFCDGYYDSAAEKAIKALIIYHEIPSGIPKVHDLSFLLNQLKDKLVIKEDYYDYADALTPYGVAVRYPNELFLTEKHAHEAIKSAEAIIQWADNLMNNPENQ